MLLTGCWIELDNRPRVSDPNLLIGVIVIDDPPLPI